MDHHHHRSSSQNNLPCIQNLERPISSNNNNSSSNNNSISGSKNNSSSNLSNLNKSGNSISSNNNNINKITSPNAPPPNYFTNHPVDTFDDEEEDEDDLRQSLNSSIEMGNFRNYNNENKYLPDSPPPPIHSSRQNIPNNNNNNIDISKTNNNISNRPINLNKETSFIPEHLRNTTQSSSSIPNQPHHQYQSQSTNSSEPNRDYIALDMSGHQQQRSGHQVKYNPNSYNKRSSGRIREIEDDEEIVLNYDQPQQQSKSSKQNPQQQDEENDQESTQGDVKKKNFFSPFSTLFGFNKKKERPRISPDTINKNQKTPSYSTSNASSQQRKYSIPSNHMFGGSVTPNTIPKHRHYLSNSMTAASPFSPFERMSPVLSPTPSPMSHRLKRHMAQSGSSSSIHKNWKAPSHPPGYYFNDSHKFISNHSIAVIQKIFHYPWLVLKWIISPKSGMIYESKVIKRRSKVLSLLCLLMVIVFILGVILNHQIWYIYAPGILICVILFFLVKFTNFYFQLSFALIATTVAINITAIIVAVNDVRDTSGALLFSWDTLVLIAVSLLFPRLFLCIIILFTVTFAYIGMGIYLEVSHHYRRVSVLDTYDSVGEQLRSILVTLVLLLFYSILSSIDLREVERKEERNQSLFKISNEALVVHKGGLITDANAAFESMFQIKLQDMLYPVPSGIWEFLPDLENIYSQDGSMDTPLPPVIETTAIDSGGRAFDVEVRTNKATYAGKPVDVFSIIDITGRKNLIEADVALRKAEAANEAKVVFLTTISHELKTPINGIMASCEILERSNLDAGQREFLDAIRMSSNYLYSLVLDILDYSKMEAGKMELVLDDFSLLKMLEDTLSMVSKNAQPKGLDLVGFVDSNVPVLVHGDATRVRQILLNLISNAIKFTDEGQIKLRVKLDRELPDSKEFQLLFEVEDSGIGIKNEHIVLLFTPFSQIDSSNSRKYQGTGLGLSISKRLANMMDGEVYVRSDFGIGSTFSFTIRLGYPVSKPGFSFQKMGGAIFLGDELENFDVPLVGPRKVGKSGGPVVGVIVDPNQWVRKSIAQYFSLMSISCMEFEGEEDCREYFENNKSGNAACLIITSVLTLNSQTIKSGSRELHWIMLTFSPTPKLLPGFEDLIQKPCKFTDIVRCLFIVNRYNLDFFNESQIKKHTFPPASQQPPPIIEPEQAASADSLEASPTFNTPPPTMSAAMAAASTTTGGRRHSISHSNGSTHSDDSIGGINPETGQMRQPTSTTSTSGQQYAPGSSISMIPVTSGDSNTPATSSPYDKDHTKKISTENVHPPTSTYESQSTIPGTDDEHLHDEDHTSTVMATPLPGGIASTSDNNNNANKHDELILLVEDNDINVKVFSRFLKIGNYNFKSALNGVEAVEMCQKYDFDLVLMDCQMPLMDGFQATKAIRELEAAGKIKPPPMKRTPKLIIIALTANNEDRQKCLNVGMDDFLPKPASCSLVLEAIKRHLSPEDDEGPLLLEHPSTTSTTTTTTTSTGGNQSTDKSSSSQISSSTTGDHHHHHAE